MKTGNFVKKISLFFVALTVCALAVFAVGCGDDPVLPPEEKESVILRLDKISLELDLYDTYELKVQYTGDKETVWTSSDTSVIKADGAAIEAVGIGTSVVKVTAGDATAECVVEVTDKGLIPLLGVNLPSAQCALIVGDTYTILPEISFNGKIRNGGEFFYSIDGDCITVDGNGAVKAVRQGSATLTVTAKWRDFGTEHLNTSILFEVTA